MDLQNIMIFQAPFSILHEKGLLYKMYGLDGQFQAPIPAQYYMPVFRGSIAVPNSVLDRALDQTAAALEYIFRIFNIDRPTEYCGRSLSVGDIVALNGAHYLCGSIGFSKVAFESTEQEVPNTDTPHLIIHIDRGIVDGVYSDTPVNMHIEICCSEDQYDDERKDRYMALRQFIECGSLQDLLSATRTDVTNHHDGSEVR